MTIPHGTYTGYVHHKCRCAPCREAARAYNEAYRHRPVDTKKLTHGRIASYNAGCRCAECKAVKSAANRSSNGANDEA